MESIDFLSPPITLFYLGKRSHTSKIGGLLIIFMFTIITSYISYILIDEYSKVSSVFYKKYESEAGYYTLNKSSLFNFIQILNTVEGRFFDKYDNKNVRIYTLPTINTFNESGLESQDHWLFDTCKENEDNKNMDKNMFTDIKNFSHGGCIKYFYNSAKKQYITTDNPNFKWPYLEHGTSSDDNKFVNIIATKCSNNSIATKILGYCNPEEEINKYITNHRIFYQYH